MVPTDRPFFLLESRLSGQAARLYRHPVGSVLAYTIEEVLTALRTIESWQAAGDHAVLCLHYEAAAAFGLSVCEPSRGEPLLEAYRFSAFELLSDQAATVWLDEQINPAGSPCTVDNLQLRCSQDDYEAAFEQVKQAIERGDTYQVNLTSAYTWQYQGDELAWYRLLRAKQPVDYSALLAFPDKTVLSLSPELFYKKEHHTLTTKPMKGTSKRDWHDPEKDRLLAEALKTASKTRAENIMIVDLMRNDLNRLAKTGSVAVSDLCEVETYPSVHQMVSTVTAKVDPALSLTDALAALFPSGSITGAPKHSTMQCIKHLEKAPRGIYTGAIGYVTPDNHHCFNIPIRTVCLTQGKGHLGMGGGLVHQSVCEDEFHEMTLKGQFFRDALTVGPSYVETESPHVAVIDHRDSFTYTLVDYCRQLGASVSVFSVDELPTPLALQQAGVTHVLFSPGPGHPAEYPESLSLLESLADSFPILGVCLGHQMMGLLAGATVHRAPEIMHGRSSQVAHDAEGLWRGMPNSLELMRYHSLSVDEGSLSADWVVDAKTDNGTIMSMRHVCKPLFGLQFHPESIVTESGLCVLRNFLSERAGLC